MKAIRLRTEYLENPIGIERQRPRLSWNCEGGKKQSGYRIVAKSAGEVVWDSGTVDTDEMLAVYPHALKSRQRVDWSVTLYDEGGMPGEEASAYFEMGLLERGDIKARWIAGNYRVDKKTRYAVDCFRREFKTASIRSARIYASACGLYELTLNGERVGDFVLAPGHTDYTVRVQMQTYDVTALVREGVNTLCASLADGWYRGSCGAWGRKNQYGTVSKLFVQLEIEKTDGTRQTVVTDGSWRWSNDGPIRRADVQDGEAVDMRLSPSYSQRARVVHHSVLPTPSNNVPLREHEVLYPQVITTPSGKTTGVFFSIASRT